MHVTHVSGQIFSLLSLYFDAIAVMICHERGISGVKGISESCGLSITQHLCCMTRKYHNDNETLSAAYIAQIPTRMHVVKLRGEVLPAAFNDEAESDDEQGPPGNSLLFVTDYDG